MSTFLLIITLFSVIVTFVIIYYKISVKIKPPASSTHFDRFFRNSKSKDSFQCERSWLRKNRNNFWEMYIEGEPLERGITTGILTKELLEWQEKVFVEEIHRLVPNRLYLSFLKNLVQWLNRKLHHHISDEQNLEIYGISLSATDKYNSIGSPYKRLLNYHAAHDIGHALQDMKYVGCTSFSVWGNNSEDGKLITGRNFDFYISDDFGKEKILAFINPSMGNKFAMVTWAGMTGAVSGMNEKGLAITINAAKTAFRFKIATPISLLIREILQYAGNIEEAIAIAKKTNVFVSELLLVSSAFDKKSVIIEKTPFKTELFESPDNKIICTNHCQSESLKSDKYNIKYMEESSSVYRYERVDELLKNKENLNPLKAAEILRNKEGKEDKNIGLGNEKAVNQLLAHHGIIFQPEEKIIYLSAPPYNMGEYMAYKLDDVFAGAQKGCPDSDVDDKNLTIGKDVFADSGKLNKYLEYKNLIKKTTEYQVNSSEENSIFNNLIELNPEYHITYSAIGKYLLKKKRKNEAKEWFKKALEKEVTDQNEINKLLDKIKECE